MQVTADGGYVVAGSSESADGDATCNAGIRDLWVIKINSAGRLEWQKSLGGKLYEEAYCIQPLSDGGFIIAGNTCSGNVAGYHPANSGGSCGDYWIVKLSVPLSAAPEPVVSISPASGRVCAGRNATFTATVRYAGINPVYRWVRNGVTVGDNTASYTAADFADNDRLACYVTAGGSCNAPSLTASDEVTVTTGGKILKPQVTISAGSNFICDCTPVVFKASVLNGGAAPAFQWEVNGQNTGAYGDVYISNSLKAGDEIRCIYTDSTGCIAGGSAVSNSVRMESGTVLPPSVSIETPATAVCRGASVMFTAIPGNAGSDPSFQWKINGVNTGTNSSRFVTTGLADGDVISCVISIDPLFACAGGTTAVSNNIVMQVSDQLSPSAVITASANDVCAGSMITFNAQTTHAGPTPSYQWMVNDLPVDNHSPVFASSSLSDGDVLYCVITPEAGACPVPEVRSNTITAVINEVPTVSIYPPDTLIVVGGRVQLKALITGQVAAFKWTPATGLLDPLSLSPLTVHLTANTTYRLAVESDNGCKAAALATVKVGRPLFMPNAFSPNGDGVNDIFRIPAGVSMELQEFSVFDRWGGRIFTTKDITGGWDGTRNGTAVDADAYVYIIKGSDDKGSVFLKGSVVLIR